MAATPSQIIGLKSYDIAKKAFVFRLIKFFENSNHRDMFLDGFLYMRPADDFRAMEASDRARGDVCEGAAMVIPHSQLSEVLINGNRSPIDWIESITIRVPKIGGIHIFSMYGDFGLVEPSVVRAVGTHGWRGEPLDPRLLKFGTYAAVIQPHNIDYFFARIRCAARRKGLRLRMHPIVYLHDHEFLTQRGLSFGTGALFRKRMEYAYQSEFRIAVTGRNMRLAEDGSYHFDIGCLRDIFEAHNF